MREFSNLVYLDLQKAATTSIVALLRSIVDEPETERGGHSQAEAGHDTSKFHFISVRDPLSIYISLFGHGCAGLGGMYRGFAKRGLSHLYDPSLKGFETWANFLLDPGNALQVKKKYHGSRISEMCGPITHRLLMLSLVDPVTVVGLQNFRDKSELLNFFEEKRIYDYYVRVENLVADLLVVLNACSERVAFKKLPATVEELNDVMPRKNVGSKIDGLTKETVSAETKARIREKEWLFYDVFGYDRAAKGDPPPLSLRTEALQAA